MGKPYGVVKFLAGGPHLDDWGRQRQSWPAKQLLLTRLQNGSGAFDKHLELRALAHRLQ